MRRAVQQLLDVLYETTCPGGGRLVLLRLRCRLQAIVQCPQGAGQAGAAADRVPHPAQRRLLNERNGAAGAGHREHGQEQPHEEVKLRQLATLLRGQSAAFLQPVGRNHELPDLLLFQDAVAETLLGGVVPPRQQAGMTWMQHLHVLAQTVHLQADRQEGILSHRVLVGAPDPFQLLSWIPDHTRVKDAADGRPHHLPPV
mmetsp:Transcript_48174/g.151294  ORF Transcript_48174/g.151294 Transcript_48174/m.151294 type:complete len:200 (-) Transcript_48174:462-1061(-)